MNQQDKALAALLRETERQAQGKGAPAARNPFCFEAQTPHGAVEIVVEAGDRARIRGAAAPGAAAVRRARPLHADGRMAIVEAVLVLKGGAWQIRDYDAVPYRGPEACGEAFTPEAAQALREGLQDALQGVLAAERPRFAARELAAIMGRRRRMDDAIAGVEAEIKRRQAKLRRLRRERDAEAAAAAAREGALRSELSSAAQARGEGEGAR